MAQLLRKNTLSTTKTILRYLLITGTVSLAASSPYFVGRFMKEIYKGNLRNKKRFNDSFSYLKRRGLIQIERHENDIHVFLTEKGEWETGKFRFNELEISKPKRWDGKWRIVVFDIAHDQRIKRNAFRNKLKELGFYSLQKSVWVHPYECKNEIKFLRGFFGLDEFHIRIIHAERIENDSHLKKVYGF